MGRLSVTAIQRGCVYDGHGVRTTIFFKGCPFSCPWCCNPETLYSSRGYYLDEDRCLLRSNIHSKLCEGCERNGGLRTVGSCPLGVYTPTTTEWMPKTLAEKVLQDKDLFHASGGGVTLSGGDPLAQAERLLPFLAILGNENVSCAIETTLYSKEIKKVKALLPYIDEWIVDVKLQRENYRKDYLQVMRRNLSLLRVEGKEIRYRLVYVESLCAEETIMYLGALGIYAIEMIKCHGLSKSKYSRLGQPFKDYTPKDEMYEEFLERLSQAGIKESVLRI